MGRTNILTVPNGTHKLTDTKSGYLLSWKPHMNQTSGSKFVSNWRILKTIENKRNSFLFLAISHINAPDFRLIPLDRNTYVPFSAFERNCRNCLSFYLFSPNVIFVNHDYIHLYWSMMCNVWINMQSNNYWWCKYFILQKGGGKTDVYISINSLDKWEFHPIPRNCIPWTNYYLNYV